MSETPDLFPLEETSIAVVGAGIAGLTAARKLAKAGAAVTLFEKSRGLGGRLATRRLEIGDVDHGAQYVTAREPAFKAWTARAKAFGAAAPWSPRGKDGDEEWLVGLPGMNGLVRALVDGFTVLCERRVTALTEVDGRLTLDFADGQSLSGFDRVIIAIPAPQAGKLLLPFGPPFDRIAEAALAPCWTLVSAFAEPIDPGFDVGRDFEALAWVVRSPSKPERRGEIWVAQANPAWSRAHLEDPAETIMPRLMEMLKGALGPLPEALATFLHRWRYALVEKAVGATFLLSGDGRIGACGDWLIAPRVEAAWTSGDSLAEAMIARAQAVVPA